MIQRRAQAPGVCTRIGNHIVRATGTAGCAAMIASHASTRTIQFYDRRNGWDEVERILI